MATKLQILQDHCQQFEDALKRCGSEAEATQIQEQICARLGSACRSEMVQKMLAEHARELIRRRFSDAQPSPAATA